MDILKMLANLFQNGGAAHAAQAGGVQNQVHPQQTTQPDITYNPNPNVDIPYSAHTPMLAQMGNQYIQNPTAPQFKNIDPGLFGYPSDGQGGVNPNEIFRGIYNAPNQAQNVAKTFNIPRF